VKTIDQIASRQSPLVTETKKQQNKMTVTEQDSQVASLRKILTSESEPLARRFRALFSLKHLASLQPATEQTVPAIEAIAAGFASPSALLKHELAYCLGQSGKEAAIAPLRGVLEDKEEDSMCRHEAAEALGALSDKGSLELLKALRDDAKEVDVVRETCDLAVERIEWDHGLLKGQEKLKKRYAHGISMFDSLLIRAQRLHFHRPCAAATTKHRETSHTRA
jgi:deoxyhypusine monooxygenase